MCACVSVRSVCASIHIFYVGMSAPAVNLHLCVSGGFERRLCLQMEKSTFL